MKKINLIIGSIVILFAIALISSCDEINRPFEEKSGPIDVDTTKKKILIEDFTGHYCGNCPEAREIAERLTESYSNVYTISVHEGPLAMKLPGLYKYDWIVPEATALAKKFKLVATPFGLINRTAFNGKSLITPDSWEAAVQAELTKTADIGISATASFNQTTKEISFNGNINFIKSGTGKEYLVVYIIEDSIVKPQKNDFLKPVPHDTFYVHKHVLRASMNGNFGEPISESVIAAGNKVAKSIKFTIPAEKDWRTEHLELIAIVRNNETEEILQVEKVKISK